MDTKTLLSSLATDQEVELAQRIRKGDKRALERLTKANLRFVVSVAKQYQNQGLSLPDLINEGNVGLIKAAEKFYEKLGFKVISDEFLDEGIPHKGMELLIERVSGIHCADDAAKAKRDKYSLVYKQVEALLEGEDDCIANMSNIAALLHGTFGFWWTGFYVVKGNELVLGPFQGPVACSRIPFGRGVCGTARNPWLTLSPRKT